MNDKLRIIQDEQKAWSAANFNNKDCCLPLLGMIEELGEICTAYEQENTIEGLGYEEAIEVLCLAAWVGKLAHHLLKAKQNIRGDITNHLTGAKSAQDMLSLITVGEPLRFPQSKDTVADGIADLDIYMLDLCSCLGIDRMANLEETWNKVKQRDWKKFAKNRMSE